MAELKPIISQDDWLRYCHEEFGDDGANVAMDVYSRLDHLDGRPGDGYLELANLKSETVEALFDKLHGTNEGSNNALKDLGHYLTKYCSPEQLHTFYIEKQPNGQIIGVDPVTGEISAILNEQLAGELKPGEKAKLVINKTNLKGRYAEGLTAPRSDDLTPYHYSKALLIKNDGYKVIDKGADIEFLPYSNRVSTVNWYYLPEAIDETIMVVSGILTVVGALSGKSTGIANPVPVVEVDGVQLPITSPELSEGLLEYMRSSGENPSTLRVGRVAEGMALNGTNNLPPLNVGVKEERPEGVPEDYVPVYHSMSPENYRNLVRTGEVDDVIVADSRPETDGLKQGDILVQMWIDPQNNALETAVVSGAYRICISQQEALAQFTPEIRENARLYQKQVEVLARPAQEGEIIVSRPPDGKAETIKTAKAGDFVIRNPDGEEYIPPRDKFVENYELKMDSLADESGYQAYSAKGIIRAVKVTKDVAERMGIVFNDEGEFYFTTAWGATFVVKEGDYIVSPYNENAELSEVYRIETQSFATTYKEIPTASAAERSGFSDLNAAKEAVGFDNLDGGCSYAGGGGWHADFPLLRPSAENPELMELTVDTRYFREFPRLYGGEEMLRGAQTPMVPVQTKNGAWLVYSRYTPNPWSRSGDETYSVFSTLEQAQDFVRTHSFVEEQRR